MFRNNAVLTAAQPVLAEVLAKAQLKSVEFWNIQFSIEKTIMQNRLLDDGTQLKCVQEDDNALESVMDKNRKFVRSHASFVKDWNKFFDASV